jgi:hypothetical protein
MLQHFLDLGVFADLSDLARDLVSPLDAERLVATFIADGDDPAAIAGRWNADIETFRTVRAKYLLYR